ncbi:hypothetical protein KPL74_03590 [Bacillus sp. NP157]|nr:hypothetical protein KPL74_03590 [Bacillus sp. NP157]
MARERAQLGSVECAELGLRQLAHDVAVVEQHELVALCRRMASLHGNHRHGEVHQRVDEDASPYRGDPRGQGTRNGEQRETGRLFLPDDEHEGKEDDEDADVQSPYGRKPAGDIDACERGDVHGHGGDEACAGNGADQLTSSSCHGHRVHPCEWVWAALSGTGCWIAPTQSTDP